MLPSACMCTFMGCIYKEQQSQCGAEFPLGGPPPGATLPFERNLGNCCTRIISSAPTIPERDFFPPPPFAGSTRYCILSAFPGSLRCSTKHQCGLGIIRCSKIRRSSRFRARFCCQRVDSKSVMWHKRGNADQVCACVCVCVCVCACVHVCVCFS